jgi:tetratricopeptide (TPR) repeat protein
VLAITKLHQCTAARDRNKQGLRAKDAIVYERQRGMNPRPGRLAFAVLLVFAAASAGCRDLRGRHKVREGNHLYREGRYADALAAYRQAEALIPGFWLLWLNEGLTCRQMMTPGAHSEANERAVGCALNAFSQMKRLRPEDARGDQLYVQTLFDADRFDVLAGIYGERLRAKPDDLAAINALVQVYTRWNRPEEALRWSERRAALQASDAEAQLAVAVLVWNQLFQKGGGPEMAAFDPRPNPDRRQEKEKKSPPPPGLGDILGTRRAQLADVGTRYAERALALRPRNREALTYLGLLQRQKSFAYFADPEKWQACVDAAERWRREAEKVGHSP